MERKYQGQRKYSLKAKDTNGLTQGNFIFTTSKLP